MDRRTFLQAAAVELWAMQEPEPLPRWELRLDRERRWRPAAVPGCWERDGVSPAHTGPVWYRTTLNSPSLARAGVPLARAGVRLWWELDALAYQGEGFAEGSSLGTHTGLWDAFAWELPASAKELTLRVEKRESTWGGPWQEMRLRATGPARIARLWAPADAKGVVRAEADLDLAPATQATVVFQLLDATGKRVAQAEVPATQSGTVEGRLVVREPSLWSPHAPDCYTLLVTALVRGERSDQLGRTVGFRTVAVEATRLRLNATPLYFRGLLTQGWYESTLAPNPPRAVFEAELRESKAVGFNGMKLVGWIPPQSYFDLADQLGVLLWIVPPKVPAQELTRLWRQVGDRPSVVLWAGSEGLGHTDIPLRCDLPFTRATVERVSPSWRVRQPLLLGELADQEGVRAGSTLPRVAELRSASAAQALLVRKHTLELVRASGLASGYAVASLRDTPTATAGLWDEAGERRYDPSPFNGESVLFLEPEPQYAPRAGGDRPVWQDRWGVWSGAPVRREIGLSHFGKSLGPGATLRWKTSAGQGGEWALGPLEAGTVSLLGTLEFAAPTTPQKLVLTVEVVAASKVVTQNTWPLWVFTPPPVGGRVRVWDPSDLLGGLELEGGEQGVVVATAWRPEFLELLARGGRVLYLQPTAKGGLPAVALPFFRGALRLFEEHPSWGSFPHEKTTDFLFYGLASDCAFEPTELRQVLGGELVPILTRVDVRTGALHAYICAAQVGAGRLLLTTLRPYGGVGDQPSGLKHAVCGVSLLRAWLEWLAR